MDLVKKPAPALFLSSPAPPTPEPSREPESLQHPHQPGASRRFSPAAEQYPSSSSRNPVGVTNHYSDNNPGESRPLQQQLPPTGELDDDGSVFSTGPSSAHPRLPGVSQRLEADGVTGSSGGATTYGTGRKSGEGCANRSCDSYVLWKEELEKTAKLNQANELLKQALQESIEKHRQIAVEYAAKFDTTSREKEEGKWKDALKSASTHIMTLNATISEKNTKVSQLEQALQDHSDLVSTLEGQNEDLLMKLEKLVEQLELAQAKQELAEKKLSMVQTARGVAPGVGRESTGTPHPSNQSNSRIQTPTVGAADTAGLQQNPVDQQPPQTHHIGGQGNPFEEIRNRGREGESKRETSAPDGPLATGGEAVMAGGGGEADSCSATNNIATLASLRPMMEMVSKLEEISNANHRYHTSTTGGYASTFAKSWETTTSGSGRNRSPLRYAGPPTAASTSQEETLPPGNPPQEYLKNLMVSPKQQRIGSHVDVALPTLRLMCAVFPQHTKTLSVLRDTYLDDRDDDFYDVLTRGQMVYEKCHAIGSADEIEKSLNDIKSRSMQMSHHAGFLHRVAKENSMSPPRTTSATPSENNSGGVLIPLKNGQGIPQQMGGVYPQTAEGSLQLAEIQNRLNKIETNNSNFRGKILQKLEDEEIAANTAHLNAEYWKRQAEASEQRKAERKALQERVAAVKAATGAPASSGGFSPPAAALTDTPAAPPPPSEPSSANQNHVMASFLPPAHSTAAGTPPNFGSPQSAPSYGYTAPTNHGEVAPSPMMMQRYSAADVGGTTPSSHQQVAQFSPGTPASTFYGGSPPPPPPPPQFSPSP